MLSTSHSVLEVTLTSDELLFDFIRNMNCGDTFKNFPARHNSLTPVLISFTGLSPTKTPVRLCPLTAIIILHISYKLRFHFSLL